MKNAKINGKILSGYVPGTGTSILSMAVVVFCWTLTIIILQLTRFYDKYMWGLRMDVCMHTVTQQMEVILAVYGIFTPAQMKMSTI